MKITGSPFAVIDGQPYLIANFTLDTADGFPPLVDLLDELLGQFSGQEILLLRRLNKKERKLLAEYRTNFEHEAWATIVASKRKDKGG